jgi:hypothetical protein
MKCPVDKTDMIIVEHRRIELDYCPNCAGVWFDAGELELLIAVFQREGVAPASGSVLTPQPAKVSEALRKCPVCKRNMNKVWLGKDPQVLIDQCPAGDGLWFDGGELSQVLCEIQKPGAAAPQNVMSFLGQAFEASCQKPAQK